MESKDNFWEESEVKGYSFDDNREDDNEFAAQVCGVSLGGTTRLSQQIKAGLGSIQFDVNSLNVYNETTLLDLHELVPEKILDTLLEADYKTLNSSNYMSNDEELHILRRKDQYLQPLFNCYRQFCGYPQNSIIRGFPTVNSADNRELTVLAKMKNRWSPPDIDSLMCKILTGQLYSLELYRSLGSKNELLKSAVNLGDGDAILMVVLFLSQTLKKSLFHQILSSSPIAVQHYVSYMSKRMQIQEVTDLLEMLKQSKEASMKYFEFSCSSTQRQLQRLKMCSRNYFSGMKEKVIVDNFIKLMEWEETVSKPVGESVSACLEYSCRAHWESKGPSSPFTLVQDQGVSARLFQWVALNVKAMGGFWPEIDSLFFTKGWLGNKRAKTDLPMDVVVMRLKELDAPTSVLVTFLDLIDNVDKKLEVAKRVQCHRAVIDIFVSQRDRLALMNYETNLKAQSEEFIFAKQALNSPNVKWKN